MIRNRTALIAAAALTVSALGLSTSTFADDKSESNSSQNNQTAAPAQPSQENAAEGITGSAGHGDRDAAETKGVRDLLSRATDAAARDGGFNDFAGLFSPSRPARMAHKPADGTLQGLKDAAGSKAPDELKHLQDRAGQFQKDWKEKTGQDTHVDTTKLDAQVTQFRKDWKEKYSQDFSVGDAALVYADISSKDVAPGEARSASSATGNHDHKDQPNGSTNDGQNRDDRDNKGGTNNPNEPAGTDSAKPDAGSDPTKQGASGANQSADSGTSVRDTAQRAADRIAPRTGQRVALNAPAYQNADGVNVQLVRSDKSTFQFAQPTPFDRQMLADGLAKHLGMVDGAKADWPADVNTAYRLVTQHVLMAVAESTRDTQRAGQAAPPAMAVSQLEEAK